jgi:lipid-binding SYLF domain-containing protein
LKIKANGGDERGHHSVVTTSDGIATDHLLRSAAMLAIHTFQGAPDNVQWVRVLSDTGADCCCHPMLPYRSTQMTQSIRFFLTALLAVAALASASLFNTAGAATAEDLNADSRQALQTLYKTHPFAADMSKKAKAVLVFPKIIKAGLVFGGSYGEGVLMKGTTVADYYNSVSGSWGLQAGAQSYGYVVFLMTDKALKYITETKGWEIGVGPTVVVVDEGVAKNLSSSTMKDDAYAFIFDQQGLMAGISIEGTKISLIKR